MSKLSIIQLSRGLAAIAVLLFHVDLCSNEILHEPFLFGLFKFGLSGVDYFFVLSGFVIIYTQHRTLLQQSLEKFKSFWLKRIIRIMPIYWLINCAILAFLLIFPAFDPPNPITLPFTVRSFLLIPQTLPPLNNVAWTLTLIMFFYFSFSLNYILPRRIYYITIAVIIFATLTQFFEFLVVSSVDYPRLKLIFNSLNLEFILGCIAAYIVLTFQLKYRKLILLAGITVFSFTVFAQLANHLGDANIINVFGINLLIDRSIFFGIPCTLLIIGSAAIDIHESVKVPSILIYLGDASYSIYLAHSPTLSALFQLSHQLQLNTIVENSDVLSCLLAFAALIISCIFYNLIEQPLTGFLNKRLISKS